MHSHDRGGECREWGWGEGSTVITVLGKEMFLDYILNESREGFCRRGRGRLAHVDGLGPKTEKAREPTVAGESGARNLEADSIRSRAESPGGCVKLKRVTEIGWSNARDTFIAESVYLVLNSLLDWEPVEKLK